jgi:hypothetical protein
MMVRVSVHFFGELVACVKRGDRCGRGERLKRHKIGRKQVTMPW